MYYTLLLCAVSPACLKAVNYLSHPSQILFLLFFYKVEKGIVFTGIVVYYLTRINSLAVISLASSRIVLFVNTVFR